MRAHGQVSARTHLLGRIFSTSFEAYRRCVGRPLSVSGRRRRRRGQATHHTRARRSVDWSGGAASKTSVAAGPTNSRVSSQADGQRAPGPSVDKSRR